MSRSTCRSLALGLALLCFFGAAAFAQSPDCGILQGNASTMLPNFAGSLPPSGDTTTGLGSSHLYVLTQWGFARAPISSPANPTPYNGIVIGNEGGSGSGGIIPILCDCHQGANTMAAAQGPGGAARFISDWQPADQGGEPGDNNFSGLPAMVAMTNDNGPIGFGQQVELPDTVAPSGRIAAIYTGSKYFAYLPVKGNGVYMADMTSPTGNPSATNPMPTVVRDRLAVGDHAQQGRATLRGPGHDPGLQQAPPHRRDRARPGPPHRRDQHVQRQRFGGRDGPDAVHRRRRSKFRS